MNLKKFGKLGTSAGFLLAAIMNASPMLLGMGVAAPAQASGGQCRWEGGPGGGACDLEDCMEDGGKAMCTEPEVRPPGGNDARADGEKFVYDACDVAGPMMWRIARWCTAMDGTWQAPFHPECVNPVYPTNESEVLDDAKKFLSGGDPNCEPTVAGDTGWGLSDPNDQLCWSGGPYYKNGYLLSDMRRQDFTNGQNCLAGSIKYLKQRELVCPMKYASRTRHDGNLQCYLVEGCEVGNPVDIPTGTKTHSEIDYRSADGLEFGRYYSSSAKFWPRGTGPQVAKREDIWRTSYSRRVIPASSNSHVRAYLQEDDGRVSGFDFTGKEIHTCDGGATRLEANAGNWELVRPDGSVENFNPQGRLTSIVSRNGAQTSITYDASGRLSTVANPFGRVLTLGYRTDNRLVTLMLPDSQQIQYGYDNRGKPTSVTQPGGATKTYHYEDLREWLLTGITDENISRFATYNYDEAGRVASEEHAGGVRRFTFGYGDPLAPTTSASVWGPNGLNAGLWFTNAGGQFKFKSAGTDCPFCPNLQDAGFDANGNYAWIVDRNNNIKTFQYDLARNLETSRTEGIGQFNTVTAATRTTTTQWHPTLRVPIEEKTFAGATSTGTPLRVSTLTYDAASNLQSFALADPTSATSRTWSFTYDTLGRMLTADGPRTDANDVTTYSYYSCATGFECGRLRTITNALNQVVQYDAYNAHGQPTLITDENGIQTSLTYSAQRQLTSSTVGYGGASPEVTAFEYWPTGFLKKAISPDGSFLLYSYDAAHRTTQIADNFGNSIRFTYDAASNLIAESSHDSYGALLQARRALFNSMGQIWQVLSSAGTDTQATVFAYDYGGRLTTVNLPMGRTRKYSYDELSRLKQVIDPAGGNTVVNYDADDNLRQVTDPRGLVTSYNYNGLGDLKQLTSPDTGVTNYLFDSSGNVTSAIDARNAATISTYDALERVTSLEFKVGGVTDQLITFGYDQGLNGKGHLTSASDANHSMSWSYDAHRRVTNKTQTVGAMSHTIVYSFGNGNLTSVLTPSGQAVSYTYDLAGRVAGVSVNGAPVLSNVQYEPFGPIGGWTWSNGTLTVRSYDLDQQLTLIDSAGLSSYTYLDDKSIGARSDDMSSSYAMPSGTTTHTVAPSNNRLLGSTGPLTRTYSYDAAGNMLGNGEATFTYNFANRMSSASRAGVTATYTYNALGQRVRKTVGPTTTYFFYDEDGQLLGEYGGSGALVQETVWLGDIPIATLRPNGSGGVDVYYVHTDHQNTPRRISRPSDNVVVWRWDSDPFGAAPANSNPDGDSQAFNYNLRFSGQYFDAEAGLLHNYFRDYDPANGRYVESDPIGLEGGINPYVFARANPIAWGDRFGLSPDGPRGGPFDGAEPPGRIPGGPWQWYPDSGNSRGGTYRDPGGKSASWDADGHWDVDDGKGNRSRYDRWGNPTNRHKPPRANAPKPRPIPRAARLFLRACRVLGPVATAIWWYEISQDPSLLREDMLCTTGNCAGLDRALEEYAEKKRKEEEKENK